MIGRRCVNIPPRDTTMEVVMREDSTTTPSRQCSRCLRVQPVSEFWVRRDRSSGTAGVCKACKAEQARAAKVAKEAGVFVPPLPPAEVRGWKVCKTCGEQKPITAFATNGHQPGNVRPYRPNCRQCEAARKRFLLRNDPAWAGWSREQKKKAYRAHPETYKARSSAWIKANRERVNANNRRTARLRRETNPEQSRAKGRRDQLARRVGRNPESLAYADILLKDPCSYCGGPASTVDHIEPLRVGSNNAWDNLTASCAPCNSAKRDHPLLFFLGVQAGFWKAVRPGYWSAREGAAPSASEDA